MAKLRLTLLGGFEVRSDSELSFRIPRKKAQMLLAYLAMHPRQRHLRDKLATLLWEDAPAEQVRPSLRQTLFAIRQILPFDPMLVDGDGVASNQRGRGASRAMMCAKAPPAWLRQWMRVGLRRHRSGRRLRKQLTVDLLGSFLWFGAELPLEDVDAQLILTQRRGAPALQGVEAHERAMGHFLQGIEAEQPQRRLDRRFGGPELHTVREQPGQRLEGELVQALPLGAQPLLELG